MLAAGVDDALEEPRRRRDVATLAEHRLEDHGRRLVGRGHRLQEVVEAVEAAVDLGVLVGGERVGERGHEDTGRQRRVAGAVARLRRCHGHGQVGAAVEAAAEHDDVRPASGLLGQLHGRLGDLGPGVGVEERVDRPRRQRGQAGGERLEQIVVVDVHLGVQEPLGLGLDGGDDLRMAVPRRRHGDAGGEVEVLRAVDRGDDAASARHDLQWGDGEPDLGEVRRHGPMLRGRPRSGAASATRGRGAGAATGGTSRKSRLGAGRYEPRRASEGQSTAASGAVSATSKNAVALPSRTVQMCAKAIWTEPLCP